jgi:hypothetical protein
MRYEHSLARAWGIASTCRDDQAKIVLLLPNEELKPMALVVAAGSLRSPAASYWARHGLTPMR